MKGSGQGAAGAEVLSRKASGFVVWNACVPPSVNAGPFHPMAPPLKIHIHHTSKYTSDSLLGALALPAAHSYPRKEEVCA